MLPTGSTILVFVLPRILSHSPLYPILQSHRCLHEAVELSDVSTVPQAVQSCRELLLWLIRQLDKFPRLRRFTLGECI